MDDVPVAQWLHTVVQRHDPHNALSIPILQRASHLHLTPNKHYFKDRPGGLSGLYLEADLGGVHFENNFDNWTTQDFVDYINRLADEKGNRPSLKDIEERAGQPGCPSYATMRWRFGNLKVLYEMAGYVIPRGWSKEDYLAWGVRFMKANDSELPTHAVMDYLRAKSRGPSFSAIYKGGDFKSLLDFQTQMLEVYSVTTEIEEKRCQHRLKEMKLLAERDPVFAEIVSKAPHEKRALEHFAKYQLIKQFVPDAVPSELKKFAAARDIHKIIELILSHTDAITAADVEVQASAMGLYEIIWPTDECWEKALQVPKPWPSRPKRRRLVR